MEASNLYSLLFGAYVAVHTDLTEEQSVDGENVIGRISFYGYLIDSDAETVVLGTFVGTNPTITAVIERKSVIAVCMAEEPDDQSDTVQALLQ